MQTLLYLCEPQSSRTPAPPALDRDSLLRHLHQIIDEHFLQAAAPPDVFKLPRAPRVATPTPSPSDAPPPRQDAVGYTFTADWFSSNIASFWRHLKNLRGTPCWILEIGCFEGRASTWLLRNIAISERSRLVCLDCNDQPLFWPNIQRAQGGKRTEFKRGFSADILRNLPTRSFDFIYIDGGHSTLNVLQDAVLSFALAKPGAIIAFDDYLWNDPK
ncbi:MAG: class I SAM-dependent methyltransferase, partial [Candidatus Acidiferrales bacterium]